jgi:hypothetical protein
MLYSQQVTWRPRAGQDAGVAGYPSLDMNFMTAGSLPAGITFSRSTVATYFDATGTMQSAAANTPRWDYDPVTHVLNGLLIEEARTNLLLNSATLTTQSVTTTAVATTLSFYGTGTVTKSGTATGALVGTGATQRVTQTFTPTAGSLTLTVTGSVTNAQLEAGATATSYIPTAGASANRVQDNAFLATGAWFNASASSLAGEFMVAQSPNPSATIRDVCAITDNTTANRMILHGLIASAATAQFATSIAGAQTSSSSLGSVAASVTTKMAAAWNGTVGIGSLNGAATVSYSVGVPGSLTRITFGANSPAVGGYLNGWVRRVRYWPRALAAAELQSVTT